MKSAAYKWGQTHGATRDELTAICSYNKQNPIEYYETRFRQPEWYLVCPNGAWLINQFLYGLSDPETILPEVERIAEDTITRSIKRHLPNCLIPSLAEWARLWLSKEDRTYRSAENIAQKTKIYFKENFPYNTIVAAQLWDFYKNVGYYRKFKVARNILCKAAWAEAELATKDLKWSLSTRDNYEETAYKAEDIEYLEQARYIRKLIPEWPGGGY